MGKNYEQHRLISPFSSLSQVFVFKGGSLDTIETLHHSSILATSEA